MMDDYDLFCSMIHLGLVAIIKMTMTIMMFSATSFDHFQWLAISGLIIIFEDDGDDDCDDDGDDDGDNDDVDDDVLATSLDLLERPGYLSHTTRSRQTVPQCQQLCTWV